MTQKDAIEKIINTVKSLEYRKSGLTDSNLLNYCQGKIDGLEMCLDIIRHINPLLAE